MSDTWDLMEHWSLVLPPSRPSATQLHRIKSCIQHVDRTAPVAVLGSTPEFRDLLYECGFSQVYVLDRNVAFFGATSQARVYRNPEVLIEGDWLRTLPAHRSTFAVILSDLTSGNVPYACRAEFYALITAALSPGGLFCDKVLTHPGPHIPVDSLVVKYSGLPINLFYINTFNCEMLFCSELLDIADRVDTSLFYSSLGKIENARIKAFANGAKRITPPNCFWDYGRRWEVLQGDYCPDLTVLACDEDEPESPYAGRSKFFVFRRE